MTTLLAFDTATERMSIALAADGVVWEHDGSGGAQASAALVPAILALFPELLLNICAPSCCRTGAPWTRTKLFCIWATANRYRDRA